MPGSPTPPSSLPLLTSLRTPAALLVFGFHLNGFGPFRYGAVGFFFILSGFVVTFYLAPPFLRPRLRRLPAARLWSLVAAGFAATSAVAAFLVHLLVIDSVRHAWGESHALDVAAIALTAVAALALHHVVELPLGRALRHGARPVAGVPMAMETG